MQRLGANHVNNLLHLGCLIYGQIFGTRLQDLFITKQQKIKSPSLDSENPSTNILIFVLSYLQPYQFSHLFRNFQEKRH